jgi:membrane-anchored glycerophosphoryl diester phosphodiesterase (GDPDase)
MFARPDELPARALAAALAAMPIYLGALLLTSLSSGLGLLLLIVPGVYISARLFLIVPIAVLERLGPIANVQRSWAMTAPVAWTIVWFIVLAVLFVLGASVLANGIGAAIGSVLKLLGTPGAARFVVALVPALAATVVSIAGAVAATAIYLRLR